MKGKVTKERLMCATIYCLINPPESMYAPQLITLAVEESRLDEESAKGYGCQTSDGLADLE